jgi:hypothetical protein
MGLPKPRLILKTDFEDLSRYRADSAAFVLELIMPLPKIENHSRFTST